MLRMGSSIACLLCDLKLVNCRARDRALKIFPSVNAGVGLFVRGFFFVQKSGYANTRIGVVQVFDKVVTLLR